jgi:hypothetical protein
MSSNPLQQTIEALAKEERRYQDRLIDYQTQAGRIPKQLSEKNREANKQMLTLTEEVVNTIGGRGTW